MKKEIIELAHDNYIDEIRFINSSNLTEEHLGNTYKFIGRQPLDIMPNAKTVIIASIYIGKFVTESSFEYGRISRLVLSGYYANIVKPLIPIKNFLTYLGYKSLILNGETNEKSIPLKGAAVKAGLGWIGKNSMLINTKYGSFQALGAILTDADISEDYKLMKNRCGKCAKCIDNCPVNAIETPKILTRKKCLSNILDGNDNPDITTDVNTKGYFFECDICQNACSWNQKHIKSPLDTPYGRLFDINNLNDILRLSHLKNMNQETYEKELAPLMIGYKLPYDTFKNNLKYL